jgi:cytochrome c oxidase cbb3-type subunit 3
MPTKPEKDAHTGTEIRSHEWDGIQEMDNPLPRWWLYVLYASILIAGVYFVLYPAIPWLTGHTKGLLGYTERQALDAELAAHRKSQVGFFDRIAGATPAQIRQDADLLNFALAGGKSAFADNCAPCHAAGGAGRAGYPNLADDDWLWGGSLDAIQATLRHGVRWQQDEDTRASEMPRFVADEVLTTAQVTDVTQYVLNMVNRADDPAAVARGAPIYAEQCVACHGAKGEGNQELGAPRLTNDIWLYEGSPAAVAAQIANPKHGVMPAWGGRLDDSTIKMLTVYVHSLGGGQ